MEKAKDAGIVGILVGTLGLGMCDNKRRFLGNCTWMVKMFGVLCIIYIFFLIRNLIKYNILRDQSLNFYVLILGIRKFFYFFLFFFLSICVWTIPIEGGK